MELRDETPVLAKTNQAETRERFKSCFVAFASNDAFQVFPHNQRNPHE
jgi:hypothetical protein